MTEIDDMTPDSAAVAAIGPDMVKPDGWRWRYEGEAIWTVHKHKPRWHNAIMTDVELEPLYALSPAFIERIGALERENARLREALKPFARIADMEEKQPDGASVMVNVSRCRDARAARTTQEATNAE